jgi:lysophospholipase L1-like esterase
VTRSGRTTKGKPFDPDHEGRYGFKTAAVRDKLKDALPQLPPPDVALIHLGTNDQGEPDVAAAIVKPLEEIIAQLRARNPRVVVLVGHLNFNGDTAAKIRALVEEMVTRVTTKDSPVATVHHYKGWRENPEDPATDTFDWAHPNPQGQRRWPTRGLPPCGPTCRSGEAEG